MQISAPDAKLNEDNKKESNAKRAKVPFFTIWLVICHRRKCKVKVSPAPFPPHSHKRTYLQATLYALLNTDSVPNLTR